MQHRSGDDSAVAQAARTRFNDYLSTSTSVVERPDLDEVLRRLVEAAMTLSDARHGAVGVLIPEAGGRERLIHVGVPALHPAIHEFLGVPLRVGETVYGNLYLTRVSGIAFSPDDEQLIAALAAMAGVAIENARLYEIARSREAWGVTIADTLAGLLEAGSDEILEAIATNVSELLDADTVAVVIPDGTGSMRVTAARGPIAESVIGRSFPMEGSLALAALTSRRAARADSHIAPAAGAPQFGPTMAIPLYAGDEPLGILSVSRRPGGSRFTDADVEMAHAFALQAGVAIELVRSREDRRQLERSRDRARIGRDLHDHVIQRLFGAGLALQLISSTVDAAASATVETQVDVIDAAIQDIRTLIFTLGSGDRMHSRSARDRILNVVTEMSKELPSTPRLTFSGPMDSAVSTSLADDLTFVLREWLTRVLAITDHVKVEIEVGTKNDEVTMVVEDDGRSIPSSGQVRGVTEITGRARRRGGRCTITTRAAGGTRLEWAAPVAVDGKG